MMMDAISIVHDRAGPEPIALGLVLGSGLGSLADAVDGTAIPYSNLPGFPGAGVSGHRGTLVVGELEGLRVAVLAGRAHYYESGRPDVMRAPLETLKALGAARLIFTNAAGSLMPGVGAGEVMLIADHINMAGANPLIGEPTDARFVNLVEAYDPEMRAGLHAAAAAERVTLHEGTYAWCAGPSFETPAEIRALRVLGADAVGMSTVPEVILARFLGLRVAAVSIITNMGAGLAGETISHDQTKAMAPLGAAKFARILRRYLRRRSEVEVSDPTER